jgi:Family of unknown function (DUF6069)
MSHVNYFRNAIIGLVVGAILVGIAWLLAAVISPDLYAKSLGGDQRKITFGTAVSVTVIDGGIGVLIGWLLFWRNKPRTWWYALAALVMVLTTIEAIAWAKNTHSIIWLLIFHIAAAVAIVPAVASGLRKD